VVRLEPVLVCLLGLGCARGPSVVGYWVDDVTPRGGGWTFNAGGTWSYDADYGSYHTSDTGTYTFDGRILRVHGGTVVVTGHGMSRYGSPGDWSATVKINGDSMTLDNPAKGRARWHRLNQS